MQFIFAFPPFGCPIGDGLLNLRIQHLTQLALGSNGKELIHCSASRKQEQAKEMLAPVSIKRLHSTS